MLIGILADTHNEIRRTEHAVEILHNKGAELLVHCGDITGHEIVQICSALPLYFAFGNHDSDSVRVLEKAASDNGSTCLAWGGEFVAMDKRIAVVHGHLTTDLQPLLVQQPDYLLSGHSHRMHDFRVGVTRRINPGALHRADVFSVATLDLESDTLEFLTINEADSTH